MLVEGKQLRANNGTYLSPPPGLASRRACRNFSLRLSPEEGKSILKYEKEDKTLVMKENHTRQHLDDRRVDRLSTVSGTFSAQGKSLYHTVQYIRLYPD